MHYLTAALRSLEPRIDDDLIDRLNYYYTPSLIIIFAILVSAKQYVGHPIECWVPAQFTKAMEQYTENYCWVQNTYWIPFSEMIPSRIDNRESRQIGYYQWIPFILAVQALLFYLPCIIWRILSTQSGVNVHGILQMACDEHNIEPDNRYRTVHILARHIDDALRYQRDFGSRNKAVYLWAFVRVGKYYGAYVCIVYCFIKILYLGNVIGQFFLLNRFLETQNYGFFGANVVWDLLHGYEWQNSGKFPRVTLCDFEIRVLGNIHRHSVQCVLVINMFTEKIFVFLWLWFLALTLLCIISLIYWLLTLILPSLRAQYVRQALELTEMPPEGPEENRHLKAFVNHFLRPDGVFILRMIGWHAGTVLCTEIAYILWAKYRDGKNLKSTVAYKTFHSLSSAKLGPSLEDITEDPPPPEDTMFRAPEVTLHGNRVIPAPEPERENSPSLVANKKSFRPGPLTLPAIGAKLKAVSGLNLSPTEPYHPSENTLTVPQEEPLPTLEEKQESVT